MKPITFLMLLLLFVAGCTKNTAQQKSQWKQEIINTEKQFAELAKTQGIPEAFKQYSAEDAVLFRENKLIKGKPELMDYFEKNASAFTKYQLNWKPEFVDVSASGDLAYTYGYYVMSYSDSNGQVQSDSGIFHTIWKRQANGQWRFVWD